MRRQVHYWHALIPAVTRGHHTHHTTSHHALHVTRGIVTILNMRVRWLVLKHTAQQQPPVLSWKNVTGTFFKKYYWIQTRLHSGLMGHVLLLFVSYSRAKKGKLIQAHAVLYLKGDGCLFDRRRLLTQNLNTLKCTIKHFINRETQHKLLDCIMINL